jgi:hypothetical protein
MNPWSRTWLKFFNSVAEEVNRYKSKWGETAIPFFRGQADNSWPLLPGVFRPDCSHYDFYVEQCLYYEFLSGAGVLLDDNINPWDAAFSMQHYGLPTRLLDWTETFIVALFFVVDGLKRGTQTSGAVWFLDPYALNELSCREQEILDVKDDFQYNYFQYFLEPPERRMQPPGDVIAIYPRKQNPRLFAQKGGFTLHASDRPLNELYPQCVTKFVLSRSCLPDAERFLELGGINEYSLFPELGYLSQYLKRRYINYGKG